jgi:hypothetical protein
MRKGFRVWRTLFLSASFVIVFASVLNGVSARRGDALYRGKEPLSGKIRGHDDLLPPEAIVCANCHSAKKTSRLSAQLAPRIDPALLLEMRQRHGGPPSRYDGRAFCRLLRTGSDPGYILIAREMPIYDLNDEQCTSLWTFLAGKENAHETR